ncbi:MAG: helix-turn-helix domain-containing protein [Candidatus Dormibacteria bacterium]
MLEYPLTPEDEDLALRTTAEIGRVMRERAGDWTAPRVDSDGRFLYAMAPAPCVVDIPQRPNLHASVRLFVRRDLQRYPLGCPGAVYHAFETPSDTSRYSNVRLRDPRDVRRPSAVLMARQEERLALLRELLSGRLVENLRPVLDVSPIEDVKREHELSRQRAGAVDRPLHEVWAGRRVELEITVQELADTAGVPHVSDLLRGVHKQPLPLTVRRINEALGLRSTPRPGTYGEWIQQRRVNEGLTQEQLARRAGVARMTVSAIERGVTPTPHTRGQLETALGGKSPKPVEPDPTPLGEFVRRHRIRAGLTQRELAGAAGMDQAHLSRIEAGRVGRPHEHTLGELGRVLNVDLVAMATELPVKTTAVPALV